ncbi:hypothetical protein PHLCEN_2v4333 [Hermanssonia centrifuga]|uniref:Uncharacterized protein n=1 Tax=Hermanssonia centrifuga TaxID=98765 RepID=A0A2R6PVC4_9APHY|nr:hypothetical protein PHLCEN_2v4333 [Hermanssonia centrifuga]
MENSTSQESCALNPDGQLKDASEITFYNSETDETPLAPVDEQAEQPVPKPRKVTKKPMVLPAQVVGRARRVQKPSFKAANVDVNASDIKRFFSRGSNSAEKNGGVPAPVAAHSKLTRTAQPSVSNKRKHSSSEPQHQDASVHNKNRGGREQWGFYEREAAELNSSDMTENEHNKPPRKSRRGSSQRSGTSDMYNGKTEEQHADNDGGNNSSDDEHVDDDDKQTDDANNAELENDEGTDNDDPVMAYDCICEEIGNEKKARKRNHRGNDDRTQDIRNLFQPFEFEESGVLRKGHECRVCRKWNTHGKAYIKGCEEAGIAPHPHAQPMATVEEARDESERPRSGTLDGFVQTKWTSEGLLDHVVEFLVAHDLPFTTTGRGSFRCLLKFQRPQTKDRDIPSRTTVHDRVHELKSVLEERLIEVFTVGWVTSDNATVNDKAMRALQRVLDKLNSRRWIGRKRRARCLEHILHLAAKAFIEALGRPWFENDENGVDENENENEDKEWIDPPDDLDDDDEVDKPIDFDPADLLSKLLALINQV